MNFNNVKDEMAKHKAISSIEQNRSEIKLFEFGISFLDMHIKNVLNVSEASYEQVSLSFIPVVSFILSHAGIKDVASYMLDFSVSGSGKSHTLSLHTNLLLDSISKEQEVLQQNVTEEDETKRYMNLHRAAKITTPALYQCIQTTPSQLVIIDEIGLLLARDDELVSELTKLYGSKQAAVPVLKTEIASKKSVIPVAMNFIGASTLSYFTTKSLVKHLSGGFVNRCWIAFNNELIDPSEITSIKPDTLDYELSNKIAFDLFKFVKSCSISFHYCSLAESKLLEFKKEIQSIKIKYHEMGTEFGSFYNRTFQNTQMLVRIIHCLKCFEKNTWFDEISETSVIIAISFVHKVAFKELDKLIHQLSDGELLEREEIQKKKVIEFVRDFELNHSKMPKIRDISQKTRLSKAQILDLTKDYLEVIPGSTVFRYCNNVH